MTTLSAQPKIKAHSPDEYLMTIWLLSYPVGEYVPSRKGPQPTAAARIADQLGVTRASVGEMLKRLEKEGLLIRGVRKEAILTEKGRIQAMRVVRRHRIVELMLTEIMGYTGSEAHDRCEGLDEGFDEDMIERLYNRLGRPERCPHGYPIDAHHELRENPTLHPIAKLDEDTTGEIVRLAEHDRSLLEFYYDAGLVPGVTVTVKELLSDGAIKLERGDDELVLAAAEARGLYVRPEGIPVVPAQAACWVDRLEEPTEKVERV